MRSILIACVAAVLLVPALVVAQGEKVSLRVEPSPGRTLHYRMTNDMDVDVTPEVDAGAAIPPMKIAGKTVLAMTQETGAADENGRIRMTITYDEVSYEMSMNGQRSPRADASALAGKAF